MGLGNLFDGATEDLILYVLAPSTTIVVGAAVAAAQWHLSRRFAACADGWRDANASRVTSNDADYRAPASMAARPEVPSAVRALARGGVLWCAATLVWFAILSLATHVLFGRTAAALVPIAATFAAVSLLRAVLVLPDRADPRVQPRVATARTALVVHHVVLVLVSLPVGFALFASNTPLPTIGFGILMLVIIPCVLGSGIAHRLRAVRSLYPPAT